MATAQERAAAESAAKQQAEQDEAAKTAQAAAAAKAAADAEAESAAKDAELEQLRAQVAELKAASSTQLPQAPDGHVWVVDANGAPIPSVPHAPESWLKEHTHLLPDGAKKATKAQQEQLQAAEAARRRPQL